MTIPRQYTINKLKDLGFYFDGFQRNTDLWKKRGAHNRVALSRDDMLDELYACTVLKLAGCGECEIEEFIRSAS